MSPAAASANFCYLIGHQGLSKREMHALHVEVTAMQDRLGISYKDAAHRLYMAEIEKLKVLNHAHKVHTDAREWADESLIELEDLINHIDRTTSERGEGPSKLP